MKSGHRLAWDSRWKTPCILEHLLSDGRKAAQVIKALTILGFQIQPYGNWFDIVEAK